MERITHKTINDMVERVAEVKGFKSYTDHKDGESYLDADFNVVYGGWRLNSVNGENGSHGSFRGLSSTEPRLSTREFYHFLRGILVEL